MSNHQKSVRTHLNRDAGACGQVAASRLAALLAEMAWHADLDNDTVEPILQQAANCAACET